MSEQRPLQCMPGGDIGLFGQTPLISCIVISPPFIPNQFPLLIKSTTSLAVLEHPFPFLLSSLAGPGALGEGLTQRLSASLVLAKAMSSLPAHVSRAGVCAGRSTSGCSDQDGGGFKCSLGMDSADLRPGSTEGFGTGCAEREAGGAASPQITSLPLGGKCSWCSIAPPAVCDFCSGMFLCIWGTFGQKSPGWGGFDFF